MAQLHEMSHVSVDIPYCSKDDEDLNTVLHGFFGSEFVNDPISVRTPGLTAVFTPRKIARGKVSVFKSKVRDKYIQISEDPETRQALYNHFDLICSGNRMLAIAEINMKIEEAKTLIGDKDALFETSGFYNHAHVLQTVRGDNTWSALTEPLPEPLLELETTVSGDEDYKKVPAIKQQAKTLGIKSILSINHELYHFVQQYKNNRRTSSEIPEDNLEDIMVDFYVDQIDLVRDFFRDNTEHKSSGVMFVSPKSKLPLLRHITHGLYFNGFEIPVGTNKISLETVRTQIPTTVYQGETIKIASLPLHHLSPEAEVDLAPLFLVPGTSHQTGVGIFTNGSTGGPTSDSYKKIKSELNATLPALEDNGDCTNYKSAIKHLIQNLDKVYFFNNRLDEPDQRAKYIMSLMMFSSGMSMNELLFTNLYTRGIHPAAVKIYYGHKSPTHIMCWFMYEGCIYLVQLKICFQEFGQDLMTILKTDQPNVSMETILMNSKQGVIGDLTKASNVLGKSLFSFKSQEDYRLFPSITTQGSEPLQVYRGGASLGVGMLNEPSPIEPFIRDTAAQFTERMMSMRLVSLKDSSSLSDAVDFSLRTFFSRHEDNLEHNLDLLHTHLVEIYRGFSYAEDLSIPPDMQQLMDETLGSVKQFYTTHFQSELPAPMPESPVASNPEPVPDLLGCNCPDLDPEGCEIILDLEWAMLMEILFLLDKLHDCAETRVKKMGFGQHVHEIHNSLIARIKKKITNLLTRLNPGFSPDLPFPAPDPTNPVPPLSQANTFIYLFCASLFEFFRKHFKSANYEASVLKILARCLKKLNCTIDVVAESRMLKLISELDCGVVNNAVMGKVQTNHPYTYVGEKALTQTVTVCTTATMTDGGTIFNVRPVYIKPRNMYIYYRENGEKHPYIKICYKDYASVDLDPVEMAKPNVEEYVETFFKDFMTVCIWDTETRTWHSYDINPTRKLHNKTILYDELRKRYFSGATPFTDKKALCDFLQHLLLLSFKDCNLCLAVYQNDLMSVIFHIITMIGLCESGERRTAVDCIRAVLYCQKRKVVFHVNPSDEGHCSYQFTCVAECLDDKEEDGDADNGDVDDVTDYVEEVIVSSEAIPLQSGGSALGSNRGRVISIHKTRKDKKKKGPPLRYRTKTYKSKQQGGSQLALRAAPTSTYPQTTGWTEYETFCYMMNQLDTPYNLYLAHKYKHYKLKGLTSLSITEFIEGHPPRIAPDEIEMEPYLYRDRPFLYYTFLDLWMDTGLDFEEFGASHGYRGYLADIEKINQMVDREFEFMSFIYNARIAKSRLQLRKSLLDDEQGKSHFPSLRRSNRIKLIERSTSYRKTKGISKLVNTHETFLTREKLHLDKERKEIRKKLETYDAMIDLKIAEYRRPRPETEEKERLTTAACFAMVQRTRDIAQHAVDTIVSAQNMFRTEENYLQPRDVRDPGLTPENLEEWKSLCNREISAAYQEASDRLADAETRLDDFNPDEETKRKSKYRKVTMDVMDTMITSYRLQVIAKQMAEKAWAPMMAQIYIKDAMLSTQSIQQIDSDVGKSVRAAISIIPTLAVNEADVDYNNSLFQKYEQDVKVILGKINQYLTLSLQYPSRSKEFTDMAKHELQKAQSINSKVVKWLHTMNERMDKKREGTFSLERFPVRGRLPIRGRMPASKSPTRSRERSSASKLPTRSRGKSPAKSRERSIDRLPTRSRRSIDRKDRSPVPTIIGQ